MAAFLRLVTEKDGLLANKYFEGAYLCVTLRSKMKHLNFRTANNSPFFKVISLNFNYLVKCKQFFSLLYESFTQYISYD